MMKHCANVPLECQKSVHLSRGMYVECAFIAENCYADIVADENFHLIISWRKYAKYAAMPGFLGFCDFGFRHAAQLSERKTLA